MNLKHKLITAFIIMIVMPVILLAASAGTIIRYQMDSLHQSYDVETKTLQVITNPIQILNRLTRGIYNEIKLNALMSPKKLEDTDYYRKLNEELQDKYSFLAVRKDEKFIYIGNERELELISHILPGYGAGSTEVDGGTYLGGKYPFLVKFQDFQFSDGGEGTIFVITDLNIMVPQIKNVAVQSSISFLIIIFMTAAILILWIYRSILKPLNILRVATNQIKEGDLSYQVQSDTGDEIGQLCEDFEEMRIRLKELIEDRLKYEEDIKELVSNISHDLKTPLTAIKGYAEGLIDGVADTRGKQEKYLKTIYTKANDMSALVDELAYYAKIDNNTIPYSFKDVNLHEYFDDCIEDLGLDLEVKNIRITYENAVDPRVRVIADVEQLKRVIHNIISNSVKYLDKGEGRIRIGILDIGEYVRVNIEDNGSGIPKEDLPYIFDRFYRADASRNSKKGGSGLGLAIAKKVIEDHAGTITADSELGVGTTISFTLRKSEQSDRRKGNEQDINH
jgi:signal transduction histidine kinase